MNQKTQRIPLLLFAFAAFLIYLGFMGFGFGIASDPKNITLSTYLIDLPFILMPGAGLIVLGLGFRNRNLVVKLLGVLMFIVSASVILILG